VNVYCVCACVTVYSAVHVFLNEATNDRPRLIERQKHTAFRHLLLLLLLRQTIVVHHSKEIRFERLKMWDLMLKYNGILGLIL